MAEYLRLYALGGQASSVQGQTVQSYGSVDSTSLMNGLFGSQCGDRTRAMLRIETSRTPVCLRVTASDCALAPEFSGIVDDDDMLGPGVACGDSP